jgi:hypothetical protein
LAAEQSRVTNTPTMSEKIEYDILNGKKYRRLIKSYISHIDTLVDDDLLCKDFVSNSTLVEKDAIKIILILSGGEKTKRMIDNVQYEILNGKKYKRLLKAYIEHVRIIMDEDLLDHPHIDHTDLSEEDAIDLTIIQQID